MVSAEMPTLTAAADRSINDIFSRAVIILRIFIANLATIVTKVDQVKISRGNIKCRVSEIARNGECFQEYLRSDYAGAEVHIDTLVHVGYGYHPSASHL